MNEVQDSHKPVLLHRFMNAIVSCCAGNSNQFAALCGKPVGMRDYTSMAVSALQQALQACPRYCCSGCGSMLPVLWDQPWGHTTSAGSQTACFVMKAGSPCVSIAHHLRKRERGFYIFSQPTRLYRCARVVSNLVKTSVLSVYHV